MAHGTYPIDSYLQLLSLYDPITYDSNASAIEAARQLMAWNGTFDAYCPECELPATFRGAVSEDYMRSVRQKQLATMASEGGGITAIWEATELHKSAFCTRKESHKLRFYFLMQDVQLTKIGQFPSYADLAEGETRAFRKVLGNDCTRELNTAIGLAAHGVGVGAFVYLRRIFESLVEGAHQTAKTQPE